MIEVVIDRLVVRGLPPGEAHAASVALESRLAALAGDGVVAGRDDTSRRVGPVAVPAGNPAALGEAVAAAVWGAVSTGGAR